MGRNPEDGQNVFFEATENTAMNFFALIDTSKFYGDSRLALVSGNIYAIYTNFPGGKEIQDIARDASIWFGESYFAYIYKDESGFTFWKDGQVTLDSSDLPMGRKGRRRLDEIQNQTFRQSEIEVGSNFWMIIDDFVSSVSWRRGDYLLES